MTLSWLEEFAPLGVDPTDQSALADLAATLADLGMIPESVEVVGDDISGVVVARVVHIEPIEGADRVRRVIVDAGSEVEVVCGAWNFSVGDLVPLATVGARLPGFDEPMQRRKMRGVTSNGMLCSPTEVGVAADAAGLLILEPGSAQPGQAFGDLAGLGKDVLFDLEIQANRPDGLSVVGVARDLCARLGLTMRPHPITTVASIPRPPAGPSASPSPRASVQTLQPDLCPRILAKVLVDVTVGPSNPVVARRLTLAGMRPVNNVVDASNYVMVELGQPTHPYDLAKLGGRAIVAREGRPGEAVATLDGTNRLIDQAGICVIADGNDELVGVAGIMGGAETEISASTTEVLLEAAYFSPPAIARAARRLGIRTEASARFEKGCDPWRIEESVGRFCELLGAASEGMTEGPTLESSEAVPIPPVVPFRLDEVGQKLGVELEREEIDSLLVPMGFDITEGGAPGLVSIEVPSWRPDTTREIDVIEEIARQYGYGRIPLRRRRPSQVGGLSAEQSERRQLRRMMVGAGALEAWTATMISLADHEAVGIGSGLVGIANPLVAEESVLRATLMPGLLAVLGRNAARNRGDVRLFELGHVFSTPRTGEPLPAESDRLAAVFGRASDGVAEAVGTWRAIAAALRLSAPELEPAELAGLHPGRGAEIRAGGAKVGVVGEIDLDVAAHFGLGTARLGWLDLDVEALARSPRKPARATAPSRFPSAEFDLAFVVDSAISAGAVEATLVEAGGDLLESADLFDVYRGEPLGGGERGLAWNIRLSSPDHTLADTEIAQAREAMVGAVLAGHGARLRS